MGNVDVNVGVDVDVDVDDVDVDNHRQFTSATCMHDWCPLRHDLS